MMFRSFRSIAGVLVLASSVAAIAATERLIDPKSTISATFTVEKVPVEAPFHKFSGRIDYDPANPAVAKASLEVQTASLDIGSADYNEEVQNKKWFDVVHFPKGTFVSTAVVVKGPGKLQATGNLTLKGKTAPITLFVTVSKAGALNQFDGVFNISRKAFGIDDPQWNEVLEDNVKVKFRLLQ
ncbi:MAG: YceI family protein [Sphingomonadaceae bacterium]